MAVSYIGLGGSSGSPGQEPSGTTSGDVVIAMWGSASSSLAAPVGWTQIGTNLTHNGITAGVWWIKRSGSAPSYTWTNVTGSVAGSTTVTLRGTPGPDSSAESAAGAVISPSVTAGTASGMLLCLYTDASATSITAPSGMTLLTGYLGAVATKTLTASGATGTKTFGNTSLPVAAWAMSFPSTNSTNSAILTATETSIVSGQSLGTIVSNPVAINTVTAIAFLGYGFAANTANNYLNVLRNVTYAGIANVYAQLHTGGPGAAGTGNVSANTTRNAITWNAASSGSMTLASLSSWTMNATETISFISLWTASSSGTYIQSVALPAGIPVVNTTVFSISVFTLGFTPIAV